MINVSKEFQLLMNDRTDFKENAEITFADNTFLELSEKDFTVSNNSIVDAGESNGIPLGVALCRSIQIELMNDDDRFSQYDFFGAVIRLYLTFQLSETVERIEYGTFTVLAPETYGTTIIVTALDDMYKADKEYISTLAFPASIKSILVDACNTLNISLGSTTFLNDDFIVNEKPEGITFRQLIGYIAMIAGGNARIDRTGRLRIITYDFANMDSIYNSVLNGGAYNPWDNPVNIDGGSFSTWDDGDNVDGGEFNDRKHFHILGNWSNLKVDTDDIVITGVQTKYMDEENVEHKEIYGLEGYVLSVENPLITGKENTAVELIGNVMVGGRFRQFSGDIVANPTCEFMDPAILLDRKGNVYISFLTDIDFQFFGFTSIKNSAEPALRNSSKVYSEATKTLVSARKLIAKERTAREQAVEQLAKDLSNSSGLYVTTEKQLDGSTIYYMHDKPTLSESMVVWKLTALAFGISTDGGKTYPYGFTVDGETITRLLYADGIDVKNLVVGENVTMGPNAKISWSNVTDKSDVAEKSDIPNKTSQLTNDSDFAYTEDIPTKTSQLTNDSNLAYVGDIPSKLSQLTNDSGFITGDSLPTDEEICDIILENRGTIITKEYIGTLKVVAGSVAASDITGDTFTGKKYISNVALGDYDNQTTIDGATITAKLTNDTLKSILDYNGLDVIASNGSLETKITSGEIFVKSGTNYKSTLDSKGVLVEYGTNKANLSYDSFSINSSSGSVEILGIGKIVSKLSAYTTTIYGSEIESYEGAYNSTNIKGKVIKSYGGTNDYSQISGAEIYLYKGTSNNLTISTDVIQYGTTELIEFASNSVTVKSTNTFLGSSTGNLGFFGTSVRSTKKSVAAITSTSTATASTVATKLNELLTALKAYNLIG